MKRNILIQAREDIANSATLEEVIETLEKSFRKIEALNLEQEYKEKLKADLWKEARYSIIRIANSMFRAMENSPLFFLFSRFGESLSETVDNGHLKWKQLNFSQIDLLDRLESIKYHEAIMNTSTDYLHKQK